jgi:hypothetical protein
MNKKHIIALEGSDNSGKTFTLNQVISLMIKDNRVQKVVRLKNSKDKTYLFYFKNKVLLITTLGDRNGVLSKEINLAFDWCKQSIDIIVYAKRKHSFKFIKHLVECEDYIVVGQVSQDLDNIKAHIKNFNEGERYIDILDKRVLEHDTYNAKKIIEIINQHL